MAFGSSSRKSMEADKESVVLGAHKVCVIFAKCDVIWRGKSVGTSKVSDF